MSETAAEYSEVKSASNEIRTSLEAAIEQDRQEAETFWADLRAFMDHGWNYSAERARFDGEVAELKKRATDAADAIEERVTSRFEGFADHPGTLDEDAQEWLLRSRNADALAQELTGMHPVEGWTGEAADQYGAAVQVQVSAVRELAGVMTGAAKGAQQGALLNRALFALARNALNEARTMADMNPAGTSGMYYVRTAWWGDVLTGVPDVLDQIADLVNVQGAIEHLSSQLDSSMSMANLLAPGTWPTGTDAAGVPPANTGSALADDAADGTDFEPPDSQHPGVCLPGAER